MYIRAHSPKQVQVTNKFSISCFKHFKYFKSKQLKIGWMRKPDQTRKLEEHYRNQIFWQQIWPQIRPISGRIQGRIDRENLKNFYAHCLKSVPARKWPDFGHISIITKRPVYILTKYQKFSQVRSSAIKYILVYETINQVLSNF